VLDEPLSFWGGFDSQRGEVIDPHHPQRGEKATGRVLVMPSGRGSSSSSTVLAEAIRAGTAPAAVVLREPVAMVVVGAVVARVLYGTELPVIAAGPTTYARLKTGVRARVAASDEVVTLELL
jgi:uncharacterized protein